jgi:hypothetical protein
MWGYETKVIVDDRLVLGGNNRPIMAPRGNGSWWAPIMEKAAAKFYGTYENLATGGSF